MENSNVFISNADLLRDKSDLLNDANIHNYTESYTPAILMKGPLS